MRFAMRGKCQKNSAPPGGKRRHFFCVVPIIPTSRTLRTAQSQYSERDGLRVASCGCGASNRPGHQIPHRKLGWRAEIAEVYSSSGQRGELCFIELRLVYF
jgi:hypothetical protein